MSSPPRRRSLHNGLAQGWCCAPGSPRQDVILSRRRRISPVHWVRAGITVCRGLSTETERPWTSAFDGSRS
jgi:hypothetical protein